MAIDWGSLIGAGASIYNANQQADTLQNAANQASQAMQFRPVGVTTRFGASGFNFDPTTGQITGAGYQVAPDVAAMREGLLGFAGNQLQQAYMAQQQSPMVAQAGQGLFNLGQQYVAQSPQAAAQNWMSQQQQLLAPGREQETAQLLNKEQQRGTLGLAVGGTQAGYGAGGQGLAASNPRFAAMYNARALEDATLASRAQQEGMKQASFGQGLMAGGLGLQSAGFGLQSDALAPFGQYLGTAGKIENLGREAFDLGTSIGGASTAAARAGAAAQLNAANSIADIQAGRNNALIAALSDPVASLIKQSMSSAQPNWNTVGYSGPDRGMYY